jgi:hypothetical protein
MATGTIVTTFSDIYGDLIDRVREATGVTATQNIAKRFTNTALHDMHIGFAEKVPWAERRGILITQAPYSTGTVTISKGSVSLTGTGTAWNTNNSFSVANMRAGGKIVIAGTLEVYEISAVGSDTGATLSSRYVGADVTDGSYTYFEDEYALAADFLRPVDTRSFDDNRNIEILSRTDFRRRFSRNATTGPLLACCFQDAPFNGTTTPVRKIRVARPPDQAYNIPYSYITSNLAVSTAGVAKAQMIDDTDEPIVPVRFRPAIVLHALYNWYRDRKDDTRSQEAKAEYTDLMLRMGADQEVGSPRPRFEPRTGGYKGRARRPWSNGQSRRYDTNGAFDRMEY